jgi:hypothetical protein
MKIYRFQKKVKIAFAVFFAGKKSFSGEFEEPVRNRLAIINGLYLNKPIFFIML